MCNIYDEDETSIYEKNDVYDQVCEDCDFLKSLYPVELMEMQILIEEKCNELEYAGSMMYDKYPDRVRIEKLSKDICRNKQDFDYKLVQVMVVNEMLRRRIRKRKNNGENVSYFTISYMAIIIICILLLNSISIGA